MRRVVAHLFVDDLAEPAPSDQDVHHLSRVLRLRPGELVSASDGRGGSRLCEWASSGAGLHPVAGPTWEPPPEPAVTVGFALTKGEHPEWAVQKLTEAGVDRIVIMTAERCVTRWAPSSASRHLERLREVARHAAMQSRRSWLPAVEGPVAFSALAGWAPGEGAGEAGQGAGEAATGQGAGEAATGQGAGEAATGQGAGEAATGQGAGEAGQGARRTGQGAGEAATGVALAVQGGAPLTLATPIVLVGPEGGWSEEELAAVPNARHVGLGPNVLRAETAAMAAGVLLVALRAGLVTAVAQSHTDGRTDGRTATRPRTSTPAPS